MSRGHGNIMRRLLDGATDEWQSVVYLAADLEGQEGGRVERRVEESYRRAAKRLASEGLLELAYQSMSTGFLYTCDTEQQGRQRSQLVVRLNVEDGRVAPQPAPDPSKALHSAS
jgi:hypothetical protein